MSRRVEGPDLLTPAEVARLFRVTPTTVSRWARKGKLRSLRTLSQGDGPGHRRFYRDDIEALLRGEQP